MTRPFRFFVFSLLSCAGLLSAQTPLGAVTDARIRRGIDHTLMARFDEALAVFDSVTADNPTHPVGWFYRAATLQSRMMDEESQRCREAFYAAADSAEVRARRLLDQNEDDAWVQFYLGSTLSYKGLFQAKTGKLVGGFVSAKKGLSHLSKAVKLDTTLADAFLGLGSYDYWSGVYYRYLRFLPWIHDDRDEGIAQVRRAMTQSHFSHWVAVNTLGWIEYDRKNYPAAEALFRRGLAYYPGSRFFLWGLADTHFKAENYEAALQDYGQLLDSVSAVAGHNGYNALVCRVRMALSAQALGRHEEAFRHADAALRQPLDDSVKGRAKEYLEEAEKVRHESLVALGRIEVRRG